jgi:hypothetical protein
MILSKNKEIWVDAMLTEELKLSLELENPKYNGLVTFFSFLVFGTIPLCPYLIGF